MDRELYAAIDANLNRALEGLRVCEDLMRFYARSPAYAEKLKSARHSVAEEAGMFPPEMLLHGRDVEKDAMKFVDGAGETTRQSAAGILAANIKRAIQAVRALEEFGKLAGPGAGENPFQRIRFSLYDLEKGMVSLLARQETVKRISGLYAILDSGFVKDDGYENTARRLIAGGSSAIQLRMKGERAGKILEVAKTLALLCRDQGALFIVNDHTDIAVLSGADGVHLGRDDIPAGEARKIAPPGMIIGASTHSLSQALDVAGGGPDYIAVGPMYDTETKTGTRIPGIGAGIIQDLAGKIGIPVVCIGGIDPARARALRTLGCGCVAAVSCLYKDDMIERNCAEIIEAMT